MNHESICAQTNKGLITKWSLVDILHGAPKPIRIEKNYEIKWEVIKIDANQGHVKAKLWVTNKQECLATAEFKWSLHPNVTNLNQDDKITVNLQIDAQGNKICRDPGNPTMHLRVLAGSSSFEIKNNKKGFFTKQIGGEFTNIGRGLIWYEGKSDDVYVSLSSGKARTKTIVAKDRTAAGNNIDAKDGAFFIDLYWRGHYYLAFYKYAAAKS
jgi:hypothetical protein